MNQAAVDSAAEAQAAAETETEAAAETETEAGGEVAPDVEPSKTSNKGA